MQYECAAQQIAREPQDLPDPAGSFKQKTCQKQLYKIIKAILSIRTMTMYDSTGHGIWQWEGPRLRIGNQLGSNVLPSSGWSLGILGRFRKILEDLARPGIERPAQSQRLSAADEPLRAMRDTNRLIYDFSRIFMTCQLEQQALHEKLRTNTEQDCFGLARVPALGTR